MAYFDYNPKNTIVHYSSFRNIDVAGLRRRYDEAKALTPEAARKTSPLIPGAGAIPLPRFFCRRKSR